MRGPNIPQAVFLPPGEDARLRQYIIVQDNLGARFERGDQPSEDLDAVLVGPVVQDPAEEVDVCPLDGLVFGKEVVRHESDAVCHIDGDLLLGRLDDGLEVLDDKRQGRKLAGDGEAYKPLGAPDLW
jgi:hypothetical protein